MRVANTPATADALRASIEGLCVPGVLAAVVQPIVGLSDMTIVGYEALTRIPLQPPHAPDWWLERAGELDLRATRDCVLEDNHRARSASK